MRCRSVFGFLGPSLRGSVKRAWHAYFVSASLDACFECFPTKTERDLELRLSEMFLLDRRGYILHPRFYDVVLPFLDRYEKGIECTGVNIVTNVNGVLVGSYAPEVSESLEAQEGIRLFLEQCLPQSDDRAI